MYHSLYTIFFVQCQFTRRRGWVLAQADKPSPKPLVSLSGSLHNPCSERRAAHFPHILAPYIREAMSAKITWDEMAARAERAERADGHEHHEVGAGPLRIMHVRIISVRQALRVERMGMGTGQGEWHAPGKQLGREA